MKHKEKENQLAKIPKIIHYCWFGQNDMSQKQLQCIQSWKKHLPDYEIRKWDETNTSMDHPFISLSYSAEKFAFVADYVRFKVLHEFGGIYLDTDMFLLKSLNHFLPNDSFFGAEDQDYISSGIIGATRRNAFIRSCLEDYDAVSLEKEPVWPEISSPKIITGLFRKKFMFNSSFSEKVSKKDVTIYPPDYFYPLPYRQRSQKAYFRKYLSERSFSVHLWEGSWLPKSEKGVLRDPIPSKKYMKIFTVDLLRLPKAFYKKIFK